MALVSASPALNCPFGVIFMGLRMPEEKKRAINQDLANETTVGQNHLASARVTFGQGVAQVFGIDML